jgi:hypothetical protein
MTTWRFAAGNTHLYAGSRLRCLDKPGAAVFRAGDRMLIEFSDGGLAAARIGLVDASRASFAVEGHTTARGSRIPARNWEVVPGLVPGELRVKAPTR